MATDWAVRGSNPGRGERFFSSPKVQNLGPTQPSIKCVPWLRLEVTTHLQLMKRLTMNGVILILLTYAFMAWTANTSLQLAWPVRQFILKRISNNRITEVCMNTL